MQMCNQNQSEADKTDGSKLHKASEAATEAL